MSQPTAATIHRPITATLHLTFPYTVNDVILTRLYGHTPNSSHIAMAHLTTRLFSRHFQTIYINAAPGSSYQTTRCYYLIPKLGQGPPPPFSIYKYPHPPHTGSNAAIAHSYIRGSPAPIPYPPQSYHRTYWYIQITHTLQPPAIFIYQHVRRHHPTYPYTALHSVHTARAGAPFPIPTLAKQWSYSPSPNYGNQSTHSPSPPSGNQCNHCPSPTFPVGH
jgi:hypothetical protein